VVTASEFRLITIIFEQLCEEIIAPSEVDDCAQEENENLLESWCGKGFKVLLDRQVEKD